MLTDNLFDQILLLPARRPNINRLLIVSGFATPNLASHHMKRLKEMKVKIDIDLIVGMTRSGGIEKTQHVAFQELMKKGAHGLNIRCRYVIKGDPVHAKTYCWLADDEPLLAFTGSANYTVKAFLGRQTEAMDKTNSGDARQFFHRISEQAADCLTGDIEKYVQLTETAPSGDTAPSVRLSLLNKNTGETPTRSGINWGQRENRDRNQAYINIPAAIREKAFFPERSIQFTVLTDDDDRLIMVRAQDQGKGLETPQNNSLLGRYLRSRMGLPSGEYVKRIHLNRYGRTDVLFTKIDDKTYLMDFSPDTEAE